MSSPQPLVALIAGGGGALASDLERRLRMSCEVVALAHDELDVTDGAALAATFAEVGPDLVLNGAAANSPAVCEREPEWAFAVNASAVEAMARLATEHGARFVTFSTNYVFDGEQSEPYGEEDPPNPRSVYARSKLAGEQAALDANPEALVVRTAGLFGLRGNEVKGGNFVTRLLERARRGEPLAVVDDQRLTPTFADDLAEASIAALDAGADGLLHLTNSGACSWYEFAEAIVELAGLDLPVRAVATDRDPDLDRPRNGVLARPRADAAGLPRLRPWREALGDYIERAGLAAVSG